MKTREEALNYALSFAETYQDAPFRDQNWQLVRVKKSKKAFLWTYEKQGKIWLNVKVNPETRDFWRAAYDAVIPGWHQNKEHWNTIILDGTIPEKEVQQMIAESYDLVTDSPTKRIYEAVKKFRKGMWRLMDKLRGWQEIRRWHVPSEMPCTKIRIPSTFPASGWSMGKVNLPENLRLEAKAGRADYWRKTEYLSKTDGWIWKNMGLP